MPLREIRLELARDPQFPNGSPERGYLLRAPLTADGHIDVDAWREYRKECRVTRFWAGEDEEVGHLVHRRGGSWAFHYDVEGDPDEDEAGYRFDSHVFKIGEYVSIREQNGSLRTFKVVSVN